MICVRKVTFEEIKIINDLCNDVKKYYPLWDEEYPIIDNFIESFNGAGLFVITLDDKIIGSLSTEESLFSKDYISLTRFFIVKEYQNKGYGRLLFKEVEKSLSNKYKCFELLVNEEHPFAFKMYEGFGYNNLGKTDINFGTDNVYYRFIKRIG